MLSGYKGSGKDFVTQQLIKDLKSAKRYAFATSLKQIVAKSLGVTLEDIENYKNDNTVKFRLGLKELVTVRECLQNLGDSLKEQFGKYVFIDKIIDDTRKDTTSKYKIISDWRYEKEYRRFSYYTKDIVTVRVVGNEECSDSHSSENDLLNFKFDYYIDNINKLPLENNTTYLEVLKHILS
jgi:asparagine N-glycosylation enzyme membrane subunit Stt3